jgi:hypothetical protein
MADVKGVSMIRLTYRPHAHCIGSSADGGCTWERHATVTVTAATVRSEAQQHVKATGHSVFVDIIDRTDYAPEVTP